MECFVRPRSLISKNGSWLYTNRMRFLIMAQQPTGMTSDNGVIVTLGLSVNGDRCAIVFPMVTDIAPTVPEHLCFNAVEAIRDGILDDLLAQLSSSDVFATFCQGEGMDDGKVPFREDYAAADHPGTRSGDAVPSQVAALMFFYADQEDLDPGQRIREAKNFIPGITSDVMSGNIIGSGVPAALGDIATTLQAGVTGGGSTYYRVLAAPRPRGTAQAIKRIITGNCRGYVVTQRRRLIPRD